MNNFNTENNFLQLFSFANHQKSLVDLCMTDLSLLKID